MRNWRTSSVILGVSIVFVLLMAPPISGKDVPIPGIAAADIKLNLQKLGLKFTGPRPAKDAVSGFEGYLDDGEGIDPDTGVTLSCSITAIDPLKIKYVTFRVYGADVAGILPPEYFIAVAKGFLGYTATLPYDGAEPAKAKAWVEENIGRANKPGAIITKIGQVEFTLAGGKYVRFLSVRAIEK